MATSVKFAIVSIRQGRLGIANRLKNGERIPITLSGFIDDEWGGNDGIDQEFSIRVMSHDIAKATTNEGTA